ncbi:ATP-binding protein [Planomonospora corallina]|uniref:ATP-binding protein n=1 Tax=Planomonospora corallina TaxID=1806052 RepID=A0ABV8I9N7_9ACTN
MNGPRLLGQTGLPGELAAVPRARRYVRDLLDPLGHTRTDDALLLVTELVANSVRHSDSGRVPGGRVNLAVITWAGTLHVDVIDAGSDESAPRLRTDACAESCGGRGLRLVHELATAWGWYGVPAGRVVWFQLAGT